MVADVRTRRFRGDELFQLQNEISLANDKRDGDV